MPPNVGVLLTRSQLDTIASPAGLSAYRMADGRIWGDDTARG
jgi:hypothetical protein